MEAFGPYTAVLLVVTAALLLVLAGLARKQLTRKPKPTPVRIFAAEVGSRKRKQGSMGFERRKL